MKGKFRKFIIMDLLEIINVNLLPYISLASGQRIMYFSLLFLKIFSYKSGFITKSVQNQPDCYFGNRNI